MATKLSYELLAALKRHYLGDLSEPSRLQVVPAAGPHVLFAGRGWQSHGWALRFDARASETERRVLHLTNLRDEPVSIHVTDRPAWLRCSWATGDPLVAHLASLDAVAELAFEADTGPPPADDLHDVVRLLVQDSAGHEYRESIDVCLSVRASAPAVEVLGPSLSFTVPDPIRIGRTPVRTSIGIWNTGDEDGILQAVTFDTPEVVVNEMPAGALLPARSSQTDQIWITLTLQPTHAVVASVAVHVEVSAPGGGPQTFSCELAIDPDSRRAEPIVVEPDELTFPPLTVGRLHLFTKQAATAQNVAMQIEAPPDCRRRVTMTRLDGGKFAAAVRVTEGLDYAYRFAVDGGFELDDDLPETVNVAGVDTPCSSMHVPVRSERSLVVDNAGPAPVTVRVDEKAPWIRSSPRKLTVRSGKRGELRIAVDASRLSVGTHRSEVVLRFGDRTVKPITVPVSLTVEAPVPLPFVGAQEVDLGSVLYGAGVDRSIEVRNIGSGALQGRMTCNDRLIRPTPFQLEAGNDAVNVPIAFDWSSTTPETAQASAQASATCQLTFECATPAVDYQLLTATLRYRIALMRLSPEAVDFGGVTIGERKEITVRAQHANRKPIAGIAVDSELPPWLKLAVGRHGDLHLVVDADQWGGAADEHVDVRLSLVDRETGLRGALQVTGDFVLPSVVVGQTRLDFGRVSRHDAAAGGPLPSAVLRIENHGRGDLIIRDLVLDHSWMEVGSNGDEPGAEQNLVVSVKPAEMSKGRHWGTIELVTNDPQAERIQIRVDVRVV